MRELLPLFLHLRGRRVVLVGAGPVGASKLAQLLAAGADIRVVAPDVHPDVEAAPVTIDRRPFEATDLDEAWLVVAAATPEVNRQVAIAAEQRRIFVNAVDDPPNATAYLGGVVRRDGVTIAISTSGAAPAIAGMLREGLDALLPRDLGTWMDAARDSRAAWKRDGVPMEQRRPLLLKALNRLYAAREGAARARELVGVGVPVSRQPKEDQ
jgi:uroporphyrin-III C-methyltransferase / precorrin-2 dehydrogenase / sirohydrochlorin ferrochelatase